MKKPTQSPSQAVDLFLTLGEALGARTDREIAALAEVVPDNVANRRQGQGREFKANTLETIKADYLGHRFLYYEPQGAHGAKEAAAFREAVAAGGEVGDGLTFVPVDVSIPLLLEAATAGRLAGARAHAVVPLCADFEEVALELEPLSEEPLFEGPLAASQRRNGPSCRSRRLRRGQARLDLRVVVRQDDDTTKIRGSCNFCHDLDLADERRAVTMLFSRRYALEPLEAWLEERALSVGRVYQVYGARRRARIAHLLLRRR